MVDPVLSLAGIETLVLGAIFLGAAAVAYDGYQKAKRAARDAAERNKGLLFQTRATALPRRICFGTARLGGIDAYVVTTGDDNEYLHYFLVWCEGPCEEFVSLLFDGVEVEDQGNPTTGKYAGLVMQEFHNGSLPQSASSQAALEIPDWGATDQLHGICYSWIRLKYDQVAFENGVPNMSAVIKGTNDIIDPRTGARVHTSNPVLCCAHYMSLFQKGPGVLYWRENNIPSLIAAANACDELVTLAAGGTEKRYEFNGAITLDSTAEDNIVAFRTAMAGSIVHAGGKWYYEAGVYTEPTFEITESMLRGPLTQRTRQTKRDRINTVRGVFASPGNFYFASDFKAYQVASLVEQDGEELVQDLELMNTHSPSCCRRIGKINIYRSQYSRQVTLIMDVEGLRIRPGLAVWLTYSRLGYDKTPMEVLGWEFVMDDLTIKVKVDLRETNAAIFAWDPSEDDSLDPGPITGGDINAPAAGVGGDPGAVIGGLTYGEI